MKLVLHLDPSDLTITEPLSGGAFPWLDSVGTLRMAARTNIIRTFLSGENSSVSVTLNNQKGRAVEVIGCPLRCKVDILYDDGTVYFKGLLQSIAFGRTLSYTIEA